VRRLGAQSPIFGMPPKMPIIPLLKLLEIATVQKVYLPYTCKTVHEPYIAVHHTVIDSHPQSVHRIRSGQSYIATGTVTGAILRALYIHLVWVTVASPIVHTSASTYLSTSLARHCTSQFG
jgi:hypothetical protein